MKKENGKNFIIGLILIFVLIFNFSPINTESASLNWDNPNSRNNPYKFKLSDYLNSQTMMSVVGCTGVVNKIAGTLQNVSLLLTGNLKEKREAIALQKQKSLDATCKLITLTTTGALGGIINLNLQDVPKTVAEYCATKKTEDAVLAQQELKQLEIQRANQFREECLNGIAYNLAKNQLTAMTKQTMNWVTSGFNGDPMYVRNINSFMNSIEDEIIYQELNAIKNLDGTYNTRDYPYGRDFSTSYIRSRQSAENFAESSKQDLTNYLTDGATIDDFANDFSKGGWYGWLGLTQHAQNNPLGYTMNASQNLANKQAKETENVKNELDRSGGFLDQKKCVEYKITAKYNEVSNTMEKVTTDTCLVWETITPGSLIQSEISNYLGSPVRQLEMADDINAVLNSLFANLISKLRLDGLSSLNSESFTNVSGGFGSNDWTSSINYTDSSGNKFVGSGLDPNRSFDLTKDLGNIYITSDKNNLGDWDANNNITKQNSTKNIPSQKLYPQTGAKNISGDVITNGYFTVRTKGDTKLINNTYNAWAVGDRAFWDGQSWQNWKAGQANPILKRGVIQTQQDYIVAATELLQNLPVIMPKLGELDYCLPGPNPNWQTNYTDASIAFNEYVSELNTNYIGTGFFKRDRVSIDAPSENFSNPVYKNYKSIFDGSNIWGNLVRNNSIYVSIHALGKSRSDGLWKGDKNMEAANLRVQEIKTIISEMFEVFNKDYNKGVLALHQNIKERYIRDEKTFGIIGQQLPNPNFIEMAGDGLNITKDILFYNNEINEANESLKAAVVQADININKLELIRKEVSKIIVASQIRRGVELEVILQKIIELNPSMTRAQAIIEYNRCLKEEDTSFIESGDILIDVKNTERCSDKLDNDLDGYVDADDSDCVPQAIDLYTKQYCKIGAPVSFEFEQNDENFDPNNYSSNTPCSNRTDFNSCQNSYYSMGSSYYSCEWSSDPSSPYTPYVPYSGGGGGTGSANNEYDSNKQDSYMFTEQSY